ncbi:MAG: sulfatase-like hydrolase/transferase [Methylococcaceae bacterium]|nr:sulfatase-like hydrolase/transferase [Methylococcaceae bacterium]
MNSSHSIFEEIRTGSWAGMRTGCVLGLLLGVALVSSPNADLVIQGAGSITATLLLLSAGGAVISAIALLPVEIFLGLLQGRRGNWKNPVRPWFYAGSVLIAVLSVHMSLEISFNRIRDIGSPEGLGLLFGVFSIALALFVGMLVLAKRENDHNDSSPSFKTIVVLFVGGLLAGGACISLIADRRANGITEVAEGTAIIPAGAGVQAHRGFNVLLISVDTLRADHLSGYGYPRKTSPNIDALALEGTKFVRAHSQAPWTLPSHGTMMTSLYPSSHGARFKNNFRFLDMFYVNRLDERNLTLAEVLKTAGYRTGALTSVNWLSSEFGFGQGFDTLDMNSRANSAPVLVDKAIEWISANPDKPFFLFVHFFDVHNYKSPQQYDTRYRQGDYHGKIKDDRLGNVIANTFNSLSPDDIAYLVAKYDGAINYVDAELGRLFRTFRNNNFYDNTLIVLASDHGEEFWDHGGTGHGFTLYEEQLHVPMIIKPPSAFPVTTRQPDALVGIIDIAPTILDYLGISRPDTYEGISLREIIEGDSAPTRPLFAEDTYFFNSYAMLDEYFKFINNRMLPSDLFNTGLLLANIRSLYKFRDDEFYDLALDPLERHNISGSGVVLPRNLNAQIRDHLSIRRRGKMKSMDPRSSAELRSLGYIQ